MGGVKCFENDEKNYRFKNGKHCIGSSVKKYHYYLNAIRTTIADQLGNIQC